MRKNIMRLLAIMVALLWMMNGIVELIVEDYTAAFHSIALSLSWVIIYSFWKRDYNYSKWIEKLNSSIESVNKFRNEPTVWRFIYDEEIPDIEGKNFIGVITNGYKCLFFHIFSEEKGKPEYCHIYSNMINFDEQTEECRYLWTAENDSKLLECLNSLSVSDDYCGEGSPIRTIKFNEDYD